MINRQKSRLTTHNVQRWMRTGMLGVLSWILAGTGCEPTHRPWVRQHQDKITPPEMESGTTVDDASDLTKEARSMHKANRRPGAWSSEAAEIERNLIGGDRAMK
jgi:hypothetical protein